MTKRKIGVYVCHCGGNISDYVDVERVSEAVSNDDGVAVSKTTMFACSDAAQEEMIEDIKTHRLDGLVVASCSPKLHLFTFRGVAERAGLNPYQYVQVNLREQDSWAHQHDRERATEKGIRLVRAGIAKCVLSEPLSTLRINTTPQALIIGAGVAGLRAAVALSEIGISVYVVEKADKIGGAVANWGDMFPNDRKGRDIVADLAAMVRERDNITVFTDAELAEKQGTVGDFAVKIKIKDKDSISLKVGSIIVATGFDSYEPAENEFGYGLEGVVTLPEFKQMLDNADGALNYKGKKVKNIAYIYCVGSRQEASENRPKPNKYCSRFCCNAAVHSAVSAGKIDSNINQYHLYRDMRTYGKNELLYEEAGKQGSVFIKYEPHEPPEVKTVDGTLLVSVRDRLVGGEEIEIGVDLVVLVTGMAPRKNEELVDVLKLPLGQDGFFNEIHPKLRPVETVIDGVFIAGTSQGPKTLAESVASSMAASSKSAALLMKGYVDLEPLIAVIDPEKCAWCDECTRACPYGAIEKDTYENKDVAKIIPSLCKGGGACVPVCPNGAIDVKGYTDKQVTTMIDSLIKEVV